MSEWIEWTWTEEKPYPETLETVVHVKFGDGWNSVDYGSADTVMFWWDGYNCFKPSASELHDERSGITHYRLA